MDLDARCEHCGKRLVPEEEFTEPSDTCTGVMTEDVDPSQSEIHDDYTEYWACPGGRWESAQDI